jgi:hypothetical protein
VFADKTPPRVQCHQHGQDVLLDNVPIAKLQEYLLGMASDE